MRVVEPLSGTNLDIVTVYRQINMIKHLFENSIKTSKINSMMMLTTNVRLIKNMVTKKIKVPSLYHWNNTSKQFI